MIKWVPNVPILARFGCEMRGKWLILGLFWLKMARNDPSGGAPGVIICKMGWFWACFSAQGGAPRGYYMRRTPFWAHFERKTCPEVGPPGLLYAIELKNGPQIDRNVPKMGPPGCYYMRVAVKMWPNCAKMSSKLSMMMPPVHYYMRMCLILLPKLADDDAPLGPIICHRGVKSGWFALKMCLICYIFIDLCR